MKEFLESFGSILAVTTLSMLVLAICHELGYFWIIGYEFQALLTTTDYLINAIFWLPFALFFAYTWIDWWRLNDVPPPQKVRWRDRPWREWIWPAICSAGLASIAFIMQWPPSSSFILTATGLVAYLWSKTWRAYAPEVLPEPFNATCRALVRLGPPAMFAVFAYGWMNGDSDLIQFEDPYIYRFKGYTDAQLRIPLRSFDKGLLVRNPVTSRIEFRRWEQIDEISKPQRERTRSLACYWFDICPKERMLTPL